METWLSHSGLNGGNPTQTFVGGTGGDTIHLASFGGDVITFQGGGNTVLFQGATQSGGLSLNDNRVGFHNYNNVLGFTAGDSADVSVSGIATGYSFTDTGGAVAGSSATSALNYLTPGGTVNATLSHDNFIDFVTPSSTGGTVANGFIGAIGAGAINVSAAGNHTYLMAYYDTTNSEAVLGTATSVAGGPTGQEITSASAVRVVGLIHESAADFAAINGNVHFIA